MAEDNPTLDAADALAIGEDDAADRPKRSRTILFAAGGVLLLLTAAGGAHVSGLLDSMFASTVGANPADEAGEASTAAGSAAAITFYELPDLVVSLNTNERKSTFLKVRITLELADTAAAAAVERLLPRIIDYCQVYLRELRPDDLRGSAGTLRLREELRRRIAAAIAPAGIRDVLFVDLLVQ